MKLCIEFEDIDEAYTLSERGNDWVTFADTVLNHIEKYTVPQYGDKGDDLITGYTAEKCVECIEKYAKRFGSNQREGQDKLDMMKIAHYAQCAYDKIAEGNRTGDKQSFTGDTDVVIENIEAYFDDMKAWGKNVKVTVELV